MRAPPLSGDRKSAVQGKRVCARAAHEMRISDWSSDVCSSDLPGLGVCEVSVLVVRQACADVEIDAPRHVHELQRIRLGDGEDVALARLARAEIDQPRGASAAGRLARPLRRPAVDAGDAAIGGDAGMNPGPAPVRTKLPPRYVPVTFLVRPI